VEGGASKYWGGDRRPWSFVIVALISFVKILLHCIHLHKAKSALLELQYSSGT